MAKKKKAWNAGLTKETDRRVKNISDSLYGRFRGEHRSPKTEFKKGNIPLGAGKTKENCESLKKAGKSISKTKNSKEWKKTKGKIAKKKISLKNKGKHFSPKTEFKKGMVPWNKGLTKEIDEKMKKISNNLKGREYSEERKKEMSKNYRYHINLGCFKKGHKVSERTKEKMGEAHNGDKNPFWQGGISFEPYDKSFNNKFKRVIRKRDNYICMKCGKHQEKEGKSLCIHHINYDKKISIPQNCCAVCSKCNKEVNFNREHWTKFFQSLLSERYSYEYSDTGEIILNLNKKKHG